jgi:hypothetical protein
MFTCPGSLVLKVHRLDWGSPMKEQVRTLAASTSLVRHFLRPYLGLERCRLVQFGVGAPTARPRVPDSNKDSGGGRRSDAVYSLETSSRPGEFRKREIRSQFGDLAFSSNRKIIRRPRSTTSCFLSTTCGVLVLRSHRLRGKLRRGALAAPSTAGRTPSSIGVIPNGGSDFGHQFTNGREIPGA